MYKYEILKTYEKGKDKILLIDDGAWYYVALKASKPFFCKYSDFDDASEVWTDLVNVLREESV